MNADDESEIKYDKVRSSRAVHCAWFNPAFVVWIHWLSWRSVWILVCKKRSTLWKPADLCAAWMVIGGFVCSVFALGPVEKAASWKSGKSLCIDIRVAGW